MITIIDYGVGNVLAFQNVYKRLDIAAKVARTPDDLAGATKLILPGVGSFDHAMQLFASSGFRGAVEHLLSDGRTPLLGVCVGMQMLAESSEEGSVGGLGWVPGRVEKFRSDAVKNPLRLPHMGWNDVDVCRNSSLLPARSPAWRFYFLHSFHFVPALEEVALATAQYGGEFACAVRSGNVYGVQFHPEKSHAYGTELLRNFAEAC